MKVYIFGASGSGTSTLGRELGGRGFRWLDTDDFFWMPTDPPYTTPRDRAERVRLLTEQLLKEGDVCQSGSVGSSEPMWGEPLLELFDLAVFIYTPSELRLKRLEMREYEYFGDRIREGGDMYKEHVEFMEWNARYDTAAAWTQRSLATDEAVMAKYLKCPILRLDGTANVAENANLVIETLKTLEK